MRSATRPTGSPSTASALRLLPLPLADAFVSACHPSCERPVRIDHPPVGRAVPLRDRQHVPLHRHWTAGIGAELARELTPQATEVRHPPGRRRTELVLDHPLGRNEHGLGAGAPLTARLDHGFFHRCPQSLWPPAGRSCVTAAWPRHPHRPKRRPSNRWKRCSSRRCRPIRVGRSSPYGTASDASLSSSRETSSCLPSPARCCTAISPRSSE